MNAVYKFILFIIAFVIVSCDDKKPHDGKRSIKISAQTLTDLKNKQIIIRIKRIGKLERSFIQLGLVDIQKNDSSLHVDLRYSTTNNFLGKDVYGSLWRAYLQPDVADKLSKAQQYLKQQHPGYSLVVFDAVRPLSIQQLMWDTIKYSGVDKMKYLTNPKYGSLHNFGAAVDISILDSLNNELDMGTAFDYFGELAHPQLELKMMNEGKISHAQLMNRQLLRSVMYSAGFFNIQTEWWHFNACSREKALMLYKIIQ